MFNHLGFPLITFFGPGHHHAHCTVGGFHHPNRLIGEAACQNGEGDHPGVACALGTHSICKAPDKTLGGIALGLNDGDHKSIHCGGHCGAAHGIHGIPGAPGCSCPGCH